MGRRCTCCWGATVKACSVEGPAWSSCRTKFPNGLFGDTADVGVLPVPLDWFLELLPSLMNFLNGFLLFSAALSPPPRRDSGVLLRSAESETFPFNPAWAPLLVEFELWTTLSASQGFAAAASAVSTIVLEPIFSSCFGNSLSATSLTCIFITHQVVRQSWMLIVPYQEG